MQTPEKGRRMPYEEYLSANGAVHITRIAPDEGGFENRQMPEYTVRLANKWFGAPDITDESRAFLLSLLPYDPIEESSSPLELCINELGKQDLYTLALRNIPLLHLLGDETVFAIGELDNKLNRWKWLVAAFRPEREESRWLLIPVVVPSSLAVLDKLEFPHC